LQEGLIFREKHTLELLISFLHPEDIVYDIGAQVGLYTVLLAKAVGEKGRVIAFEPESQSFQCLQENIKLNKLNNVRFFQKALGEHSQKLELYAGKNGKWCSLMKPPVDREDISPQIVQVLRGDDLRKDEDLPIPQLIKIDVEGWEYSVLKGLSKTISYPECKLILVEVHPTMLPAGIRIDSVKELLKEAGFISFEIFVRGSEYHLFASRSKINS